MSQPRKKVSKKKAQAVTELPDDQAIRKLLPGGVVTKANKEIGHKPAKAVPKKTK